ncbi:MAG: hypothetical protein GY869_05510, partial [Planctomycetes bacterium]|nr:hypothetical protein [Planctomycetota bacterium]
MANIQITSLPVFGTLSLSGVPVLLNQVISTADIVNLSYTPDPDFCQTDGFDWNGSDGVFYAVSSASVNITVNPINDAPLLDNSGAACMTPIDEDIPINLNTGTSILTLLFRGANNDPINDVDPDPLEGMAIVGVDNTNGSWEFTLDSGANWNVLGPIPPSNGLLLAADANTLVRFLPNLNYFGMVDNAIRYMAWDQTSGTNGTLESITPYGGITAFSTSVDTICIFIDPVNDGPIIIHNGPLILPEYEEAPIDSSLLRA